ncbi:MAG: hypothetical protein CVU56_27890 [Deltaproteobacteria bacterium HGW-Deltaproteobacteria-14]|jgi:chemotaxis signal transduction protein|nr:MAG: hypothetical protein CVU56_27890 [Deltaproteobacteria bacterium HGW-Deltaproteobacteria-14]
MEVGSQVAQSVTAIDATDLQVVFSAAGHRFSVPHKVVEQMVTPPAVVRVPNVHHAVRGVVNLRGVVVGMLDLRALIGAPSAESEAAALATELDDHRRAHGAWLDELEAATTEGRSFTLPTDPRTCEFGRWRETFRPTNLQLHMLMSRMDGAHRHIHEVAEQTVRLLRRGQREGALAVLAEARGYGLGRLAQLFDETREALSESRRDIALVLRRAGRTPLALLVDSVDAVSTLTPARVAEQRGDTLGGLVAGLATDRDGALVAALDVDALYLTASD